MGRTWSISDPKGFRETVHEVAPKLGEGYAEFIHKAVYERVKRLTDKDFEKAKMRIKLIEKKSQLGTIRERETIWLREKGHKKKNIERIKEDLNDPELEREFLKLIRPREQIADEVLKLHEELNPFGEEPEKPKFKTKEEKLQWYRQQIRSKREKVKRKVVVSQIAKEFSEAWKKADECRNCEYADYSDWRCCVGHYCEPALDIGIKFDIPLKKAEKWEKEFWEEYHSKGKKRRARKEGDF